MAIGIFYEKPNGVIVYTYSFDGRRKEIGYYDDDGRYGTVSYSDFELWKERRDLKDFPNARDPRLPYVFDLHWDIKNASQLIRVLSDENSEDHFEVKKYVEEINFIVPTVRR